MVNQDSIYDIVRQIVTRFAPQKVILFGSYAAGRPSDDSDVDLLVVMDFNTSPTRQAVAILRELDYHFGLDLIARTPAAIKQRLQKEDFFIREITEKGKVLYERTH